MERHMKGALHPVAFLLWHAGLLYPTAHSFHNKHSGQIAKVSRNPGSQNSNLNSQLSKRDTNISIPNSWQDLQAARKTLNHTLYETLPQPNDSADTTDLLGAPFNGSIWYNNETLYNGVIAPDLFKYLFCVCNCTYVSWACCHAREGIVHEPASNNQGVVDGCSLAVSGAGATSASPSASRSNVAISTTCQGDCHLGTCQAVGNTGGCTCTADSQCVPIV